MDNLQDLNLHKKRLLIREDLNVPIENGQVASDARLLAALPTIQFAQEANAKIILCSHLGRPTEGEFEEKFSLAPVAKRLGELLKQPVRLIKNWQEPFDIDDGEVVLLENVRFNVGEKKNDPELSKAYAKLCDIFVMDAFATAHRAQASTAGVIQFAPQACAGPLLSNEIKALTQALTDPEKPMVAIVGGSKISTKLSVLQVLSEKVDQLIIGGGIANTFIAASGFEIGKSLYEADLIPMAKELIKQTTIPIPSDVVVANEFSEDGQPTIKKVSEVNADEMILDVGPQTAKIYADICESAGTIIWNGPIGVFEWKQFSEGTKTLALAIAESKAFSIAGGGDTLAALEKFEIYDEISYVSTGGGAFLEFIEGKKLPAIAALELKSSQKESITS